MELELQLDSLDGLDAALQPFYAKGEDGKFRLAAKGLPEIQSALRTANKEAADRRRALDAYKDVDPERYRELLKADEERATKKAQDEGDFKTLKEQMAAKHAQELADKDKKLDSYRSQLERKLIDAEAVAAIVAAKGIPELLLPIVKSRVKALESNGEFGFQILNPDGTPMIADGAGTPANFGNLIESLKANPTYGRAFEGSGASGGGAHQGGTANAPKPMALAAFNELSPSERKAFMAAGGTCI